MQGAQRKRIFAPRFVAAAIAALAVAGCSEIDRDMSASVRGKSCFAQSLAREYYQVAYFLDSHAFVLGGEKYRTKAGEAARGKSVPPEIARDALLGLAPERGELEKAQKELTALEGHWPNVHLTIQGAEVETALPMELARAQGRYDCWVETSIRPWLHGLEEACKADFGNALCYVKLRLDKPMPFDAPIPCDGHTTNGWGSSPASGDDTDVWHIERSPMPWEC